MNTTMKTREVGRPEATVDRPTAKQGKTPRTVSLAGLALLTMATVLTFVGVNPASAAQRYTVTANSVALRSGPGTGYAVLGRVNQGTPIDVACQVQNGTSVGGNRTWDKLTNGQWISDYYTTSPSFNSYAPGLGDCNAAPPAATRESKAVAWAIAEKNSPDPTWSDQLKAPWSGYCEALVEIAFGTRYKYGSAIANYNAQNAAGRIHRDTNAPAGALVYYGGGGGYGHVGISLGGGQVISTQGYGGQRLPVKQHGITALSNPYYGWAYAPSGWPGR